LEKSPPVSVGDVKKVKIEAMGNSGDGIAKIKGFVVFVPGTSVNDVVRVRYSFRFGEHRVT